MLESKEPDSKVDDGGGDGGGDSGAVFSWALDFAACESLRRERSRFLLKRRCSNSGVNGSNR